MEDILDEIQLEDTNIKDATKGKRFTNYLIDMVFFYVLVFVGSFLYYGLVSEPLYLEEEEGFDLMGALTSMLR